MEPSHQRHVHFVGSLPRFDESAAAFAWQLNELEGKVRRLCGGETGERLLWFVHLPMCWGDDHPPTTHPAFYAPLRRLRLPADVRVVAGIAHEGQDPQAQLRVRALVEEEVGRRVDIATACGLGRRTPDQARRAVDSMLALLAD